MTPHIRFAKHLEWDIGALMFFWKKGRLKQDLASLGKADKTVSGDRISTFRYRSPKNSQQVCRRACTRIFLAGYFLMQGRVGCNLVSITGERLKCGVCLLQCQKQWSRCAHNNLDGPYKSVLSELGKKRNEIYNPVSLG